MAVLLVYLGIATTPIYPGNGIHHGESLMYYIIFTYLSWDSTVPGLKVC